MPNIASRQAFGEALAELGGIHSEIVVLDADLSKSTKSELFAKKYPDRFIEMGIAEANMIGTGAGLALSGKIPFICSFGCFVTGRFDQIRLSVGYSNANVKIVGTHAGIAIGEDGYSQMALEDIALMRSIPGMSVLQPSDDIETKQAVKYLVENFGPAYLRLTRQNLKTLHTADYKFQFGKADLLKDGKDIAIFATGGTVANALEAATTLEKEGLNILVANFHTLKPIDADFILQTAKKTRAILTVEDHTIIGGLGSAVCEVVAGSGLSTKVIRHGTMDVYGESGTPESLYEKYGFTASGIVQKIKKINA